MSETIKTKLIAGRFKYPATLTFEEGRIYVRFKYNKTLLEEIKSMQGRKWHGYDDVNPRKVWSIVDNSRNRFQLAYLQGKNPYAKYDVEIPEIDFERPVYTHQKVMTGLGLAVHYCLWAAEMGTGKTLSAIEVMERSGLQDWWWLGPKSALKAVELELLKWQSKVWPEMYTYERLKKILEDWPKGQPAPRGVIFDESSKIKTPTAQRSQAAFHLAENIRRDHGVKGYVILMSGSPAPKAPTDWWHQCEVACPGFLKEGDIYKFKDRLGLVQKRESIAGGVYPHLVGWWDDPKKCKECGELEDYQDHDLSSGEGHAFQKSVNEVESLYRRMKGLVLVQFKKDCLDLPDKQYKIIQTKLDKSILRVAKTIMATAPRVVTANILLRELSDGFQYDEVPIGEQVCPRCKGTKFAIVQVPVGDGEIIPGETEFVEQEQICPLCGGAGEIPKTKREAIEVICPKDEVLKDILSDHEEIGRLVIYAGFTGSVDRCVSICHSQSWSTIRVDGRGWDGRTAMGDVIQKSTLLQMFQYGHEEHTRVAFVGQPGAAGMGLTLTASPTIVYFSNDFHAEHRIQSEDRIHRPGMDTNLGATIIDIFHLPTDENVLNNLKAKRKLQDMSMGELQRALQQEVEVERR